jgi:hypothetical protein
MRVRHLRRPRPPTNRAGVRSATRRALCFGAYSLYLQCDGREGTRPRCRHGSHYEAQKAGRALLLRLVAEYGPLKAARILRKLADEIEANGRPRERRGVGHL